MGSAPIPEAGASFRRTRRTCLCLPSFDILSPSGDAFGKGLVNRMDKVVREVVVVDKSAVSDCAIEHFYLFSVHITTLYKCSLKFIQYFFHQIGSDFDGVLSIFAVNLAYLAN